jgi:hypothetical protein
MNLATLEAALPDSVVAALNTAPASIVLNAAANVYVADKPRTTGRTSPEAWLAPLDLAAQDAPDLGKSVRVVARYALRVEKDGLTLSERRDWCSSLLAYFHGYRRPNHDGLWRTMVESIDPNLHDEEGPTSAILLVLAFEEV